LTRIARTLARLGLAAAAMSPGGAGAVAAPGLSVCIDTASATAPRDQALAQTVATRESLALTVFRFDSSDDDEGMDSRQLSALLAKHCDLIMGYPMDRTGGAPPDGLAVTAPYDQTGFVLATIPPLPATGLADLPQDTVVSVTYGSVGNLYFLSHHNVQSDIELSEAATLAALTAGKVQAAILWQPDMTAYLTTHPASKIRVQALAEPHARFDIVALYGPSGADAAARFAAALTPPRTSGTLIDGTTRRIGLAAPLAYVHQAADTTADASSIPALYTASQAHAGGLKYADDCAQCHGAALEGQAGPALKGKLFASVKTGFSVGDILSFMSVNMHATQPGSLSHDDYTDIMAYVLAQNGFPAGSAALTFDAGTQSQVPLLYHGP
jgi:polar amino acid transport system substrate-binding protein